MIHSHSIATPMSHHMQKREAVLFFNFATPPTTKKKAAGCFFATTTTTARRAHHDIFFTKSFTDNVSIHVLRHSHDRCQSQLVGEVVQHVDHFV
jgi:hypothetical protein